MPLNFQQVILNLQQFWAERGCVLWQPYYTQVGAGTMNPATFLRVLGPEPWNVAYVEPSIRPDDGRYGENPNRFQQHYQYQVILKPDPGNPQEIYLDSLKAIPSRPQPFEVLGYCDARLGLDRLAVGAMEGGVDRDPENWELFYGLALVRADAGLDPRPAARQALRLVELLEDLDDVSRVTANFDIPEEVFAEVAG